MRGRMTTVKWIPITVGMMFLIQIASGISDQMTPVPTTLPPRLPKELTKEAEMNLALEIARAYELNREQAMLLLAIREHEAGRVGKEFGVELDRAKQFEDGRRSFCVQACYAAQTIRRWCPDARPANVKRFNHGYVTKHGQAYPGWAEDPDWWKKIGRHLVQFKNILYY
jgi:hypothetical protein